MYVDVLLVESYFVHLRAMIERNFIDFYRAIRIFAFFSHDAFTFDYVGRLTDGAWDRDFFEALDDDVCWPARYWNDAAK